MTSILILLTITGLTIAGDYFIKLASDRPDGLTTVIFAAGLMLYALPAIGWFFLMRSHSLAALGVLYSASILILLAAMGTLVFKEAFGLREVLGIGLAIASVMVITHEA
jgi:undecaprenyl phosphate-alpha-L-ara4N flippase subunit ArnF